MINSIKPCVNMTHCVIVHTAKFYNGHELVSEPSEPFINQEIDYRALSVRSQIENGTINKGVDMTNFALSPLDTADSLTSVADALNSQIDSLETSEKDKQEKERKIKEIFGLDD